MNAHEINHFDYLPIVHFGVYLELMNNYSAILLVQPERLLWNTMSQLGSQNDETTMDMGDRDEPLLLQLR